VGNGTPGSANYHLDIYRAGGEGFGVQYSLIKSGYYTVEVLPIVTPEGYSLYHLTGPKKDIVLIQTGKQGHGRGGRNSRF